MSKPEIPFRRPQASADEPTLRGSEWIAQQWDAARLANAALCGECTVHYWREGNREVDFIVQRGRHLTAIEVKGGRAPQAHAGIAAFTAAIKPQRSLLVGGDGIALEDFLMQPATHWIRS